MGSEALERALEEKASGRYTTVRDWLRAHPPDPARFTQTLASVAERTRSGEPFMVAVREFLDEFSFRQGDQRAAALAEAPRDTGDPRYDAFLGALAEHVAIREGLAVPRWATQASRFLDRFWFISSVPGFRAIAIASSPAAFRRRGIFIHPRALERV